MRTKTKEIIQFFEIPTNEQHQQIIQSGIQLLEYLPRRAYLAAIPVTMNPERLVALNVRSVLDISLNFKVANNLKQASFPNWAIQKDRVEVMIKYYKNIKQSDLLPHLEEDGIMVEKFNGYNNFFKATIKKDKVVEIASLPYVSYLELGAEPAVADDDLGRSLHRSNMIDAKYIGGRSYTGAGLGVLVRDDGGLGPHIDYHGRLTQEFIDGGNPKGKIAKVGPSPNKTNTGTTISFSPDPTIFAAEGVEFVARTVTERLQTIAFLNRDLEIVFADERADTGITEFDFRSRCDRGVPVDMVECRDCAVDVPDRVPERAHLGPVLVSESPTIDRRRAGVSNEDRAGVSTIPCAGNLEGDGDVRRRCAGRTERERERRNPGRTADVDSMLHDRSPVAPDGCRPIPDRAMNRDIRTNPARDRSR